VTLDGTKAEFGDLQPGDNLELSGQPATSIKASRPVPVDALGKPIPGAAKTTKTSAAKAAADKKEADRVAAAKASAQHARETHHQS
jgi:hypothetical protein